MIDQITLQRIRTLHPKIVDEVMSLYIDQIVPALKGSTFCRFAYTLRTFKEQNELYEQGRSKLFDINGKRLGKVTNAKGGQSFHNYGLALDIVLIDGAKAYWDTVKDFDNDGDPDWMEIVNIFQRNGWEWGHSFNDDPHFQKTLGYTWNQLFDKYNQGDFISGTNYVNL